MGTSQSSNLPSSKKVKTMIKKFGHWAYLCCEESRLLFKNFEYKEVKCSEIFKFECLMHCLFYFWRFHESEDPNVFTKPDQRLTL